MRIRDKAKINLARRVPSLFDGRPPAEVGWAWLLFVATGVELLTAAYKAFALVLLVWLIHRYWWAGMPGLGYLPAFGIVLLARLAWPLPGSEPPGTVRPDPAG